MGTIQLQHVTIGAWHGFERRLAVPGPRCDAWLNPDCGARDAIDLDDRIFAERRADEYLAGVRAGTGVPETPLIDPIDIFSGLAAERLVFGAGIFGARLALIELIEQQIRSWPRFANQLPERLADELAVAAKLGVEPVRAGTLEFVDAVNTGTIKFVVTEGASCLSHQRRSTGLRLRTRCSAADNRC